MYEDLYTPFKHKEIIYGDSNSIITDMYGFLEKNKLRISDETNGFIDDNHGGYIGNKKIAQYVYDNVISNYSLPNYTINQLF